MDEQKLIQLPRRSFIGLGIAGVVSLLQGCGFNGDEDNGSGGSSSGGGSSGGSSGTSGTGVVGLNTPSQILSNSNVNRAISQARSYGASFNLFGDSAVNPPYLVGRYSIAGERYYPNGPVNLASGLYRIYNQTPDNKINTDYDQVFQVGTSSLGEIIRGSGNSFTIYSILNINDINSQCSDRAIMIFDGVKTNNNVQGYYVMAPTNSNSSCLLNSGGFLYLTKTGSSKPIILDENQQEFNGLAGFLNY